MLRLGGNDMQAASDRSSRGSDSESESNSVHRDAATREDQMKIAVPGPHRDAVALAPCEGDSEPRTWTLTLTLHVIASESPGDRDRDDSACMHRYHHGMPVLVPDN
eukprot:1464145-Rhodomonas_salina.2